MKPAPQVRAVALLVGALALVTMATYLWPGLFPAWWAGLPLDIFLVLALVALIIVLYRNRPAPT